MSFNIFLAVLPVLFVYFFRTTKSVFLKIVLGSLWIAFLPNTIYLLLDLIHLPHDFRYAGDSERIILALMYISLVMLGLITYYFAFQPLEALFPYRITKKRNLRLALLLLCNGIVGFALVLGRVLRVNSWDIVLNPAFVFHSSLVILRSYHLILLCVIFTLLSTGSYLIMKKVIFLPVVETSKKQRK
jgi:uncharacterized membrane protein